MKTPFLLTAVAAATLLSTARTNAAISLNFGNGELNVTAGVPSTGAVFPNGSGQGWFFSVNDSTGNVTGVPTGVSFDVLVSTNVGTFGSQTNAIGITSDNGGASAGFDNGTTGVGTSTADEGFFFSIDNVAGLAPGESMYISGFGLTFIQLANGDSWEVNSDGVVTASANGDVLAVPTAQALTGSIFARSNPGSAENRGTAPNATRLGLASLELTVIPEPSVAILGAAGLLLCLSRRRK